MRHRGEAAHRRHHESALCAGAIAHVTAPAACYAAAFAGLRSMMIFFNSGTHDPQFVPHLSFSCIDASTCSGSAQLIQSFASSA